MGGGGGGTPLDTVKKTVKGAAKSGLKVASGGLYDPNTGTIKTGEDQLANVMSGVSGNTLMTELAGPAPKIPTPEDPKDQAKRAEVEVAKKVEPYIKSGLASTMLGGSLGDASNLRKKKLLGE